MIFRDDRGEICGCRIVGAVVGVIIGFVLQRFGLPPESWGQIIDYIVIPLACIIAANYLHDH